MAKIDKRLPPPWYVRCVTILLMLVYIPLLKMMWQYCRDWVQLSGRYGEPFELRDGWIPGQKVDLSDRQYQTLRGSLKILLPVMITYLGIATFIKRRFCKYSLEPMTYFYLAFSFIFICAIHMVTAIFPIIVVFINFAIAKLAGKSKWNVALTWVFNMVILFTSDYFSGYRFERMFGENLAFLDDYRGSVNWATCFNLLMCRLIAFNMDYRECLIRQEKPITEQLEKSATWTEYRIRQERLLDPKQDFSLKYYLIFVFYVPLYLAGPVMSYTPFYSFVKTEPQKEVPTSQIVRMTVMTCMYAILLDVVLHFVYIPGCIEYGMWQSHDAPPQMYYYVNETPFRSTTPLETASMGYLYLLFMYMKFLIIWRAFRIWALFDGINPPENMVKCINNCSTVSEFWRTWHRSLYLFIVRYIYVPLGGGKNKIFSVWVIFIFMGAWHDLYQRWMAWAFFNCCCFVIEAFFTHFVANLKFVQDLKKRSEGEWFSWYNSILSLLYSVNFVLLIIANLSILNSFGWTFHFVQRIFFNEGSEYIYLTVVTLVSLNAQLSMYKQLKEQRQALNK